MAEGASTASNENSGDGGNASSETAASNAELHFKAGVDHHSRGRRANAEAAYREAIRLDPRYYRPHFDLGNVLWLLKRYAEVEAYHREALWLAHNLTEAQINLDRLLKKLKPR